MTRLFRWFCFWFFLATIPPAGARSGPQVSLGEKALVNIEISYKQYDLMQPWTRRTATLQKFGVLSAGNQILTTAEWLANHTLIRLQKGGRGKWWDGQLVWIDFHANLALVGAKDPAFLSGLKPLKLADPIPTKGAAELVRWRDGILETRKAEINRMTVKRSKLSFVEYFHVEVDSEIRAAGWSEPVLSGNQLYGLTIAQDGDNCTVLPSPLIRTILDAQKKGAFRGLGYFNFIWQRAEDPVVLRFLKLEGDPRGVVIADVPAIPGQESTLKPKDVILQVDGFAVDTQGDYKDPLYGKLSLENLATRNKWAGDEVKFSIWRDAQLVEVNYRLPKADFSVQLVPEALFDQEPEYYLIGGLVFQPLTLPYLRSWGADWRRRVPFRLSYYEQQKPTLERPTLVILSLLLPDPYNLGYQDFRYLVVESVNGERISRISDLPRAFQKPINGFHIIEFDKGDSLRRMVLNASEAAAATRRVMERYGVDKAEVFNPVPTRN